MENQNKLKVILTGGGTMGSVSPLIAVYEELKKRDANWEAIWIGTKEGPEGEVVKEFGIPFFSISNGRLRRFFSFKNLVDPFKVLWGIHQAKKILKEFKPNIVLTAGSFVSYPVARAASKLGIPVFIHQQDIEKGLANKMMEKYASMATAAFDPSIADFNYKKVALTSNPARMDRLQCDKAKAHEFFKLDPARLTVLVMGGGTGAQAINQLTLEALGELTAKHQVLHLTGVGKSVEHLIPDFYDRETQVQIRRHYKWFEFLNQEMCLALQVADVVVSRAGISSLTELSLLQKPSVIIPIPNSHQEKNAQFFAKTNAVKYLHQTDLTGAKFAHELNSLLSSQAEMQNLSRNIAKMIDPGAAKRYVDLIYSFLQI